MVSTLDCYAGGLLLESGILPVVKYACGEQWPATMLAIQRSVGVAIRECTSHMPPPNVNMASHSVFETPERRHHTKV